MNERPGFWEGDMEFRYASEMTTELLGSGKLGPIPMRRVREELLKEGPPEVWIISDELLRLIRITDKSPNALRDTRDRFLGVPVYGVSTLAKAYELLKELYAEQRRCVGVAGLAVFNGIWRPDNEMAPTTLERIEL